MSSTRSPSFLDQDGARPDSKKRKVRKGTRGCWECKRRKIKCSFAISTKPNATVCDGCERRHVTCLSQEYPDPHQKQTSTVVERLDRVERLLASKKQRHELESEGRTVQDSQHSQTEDSGMGLSESTSLLPLTTFTWDGQKQHGCFFESRIPTHLDVSRELINTLVEAWPLAADLELIHRAPLSVSGLFHGLIFRSYRDMFSQPFPPPRDLLRLPPSGSHPVLFAKKLMLLALFLQNFTPTTLDGLGHLTRDPRDITRQILKATHLVSSSDELTDTIEGIEVIMMESMFHNNAGELRRAHVSMRRALALAQMMGLHKGLRSQLLRVADRDTPKRVKPEYMWFRVLQSDQYLSLMLGLPLGSADESFVAHLEDLEPQENMERLILLAGGRLVRRIQAGLATDLQTTREIDTILLGASSLMPPQWWLDPNSSQMPISKTLDDEQALQHAIRTMTQLAYYHLIARLHLPCLLEKSPSASKYSKVMAITANRDLLSRFVSFRSTLGDATPFCRGADFLGFIASTALCVAHIDAHLHKHLHQIPASGTQHHDDDVFNHLIHQRLTDRGMMEVMLETMKHVSTIDVNDDIAATITNTLRQLLSIESRVFNGDFDYMTGWSADNNDDGQLECSGKAGHDGSTLRIRIPHLGLITVERSLDSSAVSWEKGRQKENERDTPLPYPPPPNDEFGLQDDAALEGSWFNGLDPLDNRTLQGVDIALFDNLFACQDSTQHRGPVI